MVDGKIVHRIEDGMSREGVYATTYRIKDVFKQWHDFVVTPIDAMNYMMHWKLMDYIKKDDDVLEFCMGAGNLLQFLKRTHKDINKYVGIDINPKAIEQAKLKCGYRDIEYGSYYPFPCKFIHGDVAEADALIQPKMTGDIACTHRFDVIIYVSSFEHMKKEAALSSLKEAHKLLKTGGTLLLSTPNADKHEKPYRAHLHEWTRLEVLDALKEAGFVFTDEIGLLITKGDVPENVMHPEIVKYIPYELYCAIAAAPFPKQSKEVLFVCQKGRSVFDFE